MNTISGVTPAENGDSLNTRISASFPTLIEPTRLSTPRCLAGLIVMAFSASVSLSPFFMAIAAHIARCCCGITGASVTIETLNPFSARIAGVFHDLFCNSNFEA